MFNLKQTWEAMREERASMQAELDRLDRAISALASVVGGAAVTKAKQATKKPGQTPQARKPYAAKMRSKRSEASKPKAKISAAGLRNIIQAQKKRWAKVRAAEKSKAKVSRRKAGKRPVGTR